MAEIAYTPRERINTLVLSAGTEDAAVNLLQQPEFNEEMDWENID